MCACRARCTSKAVGQHLQLDLSIDLTVQLVHIFPLLTLQDLQVGKSGGWSLNSIFFWQEIQATTIESLQILHILKVVTCIPTLTCPSQRVHCAVYLKHMIRTICNKFCNKKFFKPTLEDRKRNLSYLTSCSCNWSTGRSPSIYEFVACQSAEQSLQQFFIFSP